MLKDFKNQRVSDIGSFEAFYDEDQFKETNWCLSIILLCNFILLVGCLAFILRNFKPIKFRGRKDETESEVKCLHLVKVPEQNIETIAEMRENDFKNTELEVHLSSPALNTMKIIDSMLKESEENLIKIAVKPTGKFRHLLSKNLTHTFLFILSCKDSDYATETGSEISSTASLDEPKKYRSKFIKPDSLIPRRRNYANASFSQNSMNFDAAKTVKNFIKINRESVSKKPENLALSRPSTALPRYKTLKLKHDEI